jgi:hypothetical protein
MDKKIETARNKIISQELLIWFLKKGLEEISDIQKKIKENNMIIFTDDNKSYIFTITLTRYGGFVEFINIRIDKDEETYYEMYMECEKKEYLNDSTCFNRIFIKKNGIIANTNELEIIEKDGKSFGYKEICLNILSVIVKNIDSFIYSFRGDDLYVPWS